MYHQWNWITFLHWRYPAAAVERVLPAGLRAETCEGSAWVGLTPFRMEAVRLPGFPALPWISRFPEIAERERDELANFLTARFRLFTRIAGKLVAAEAEHPDWPLRHAHVHRLDENLLHSAGLPAPTGDPLAHASRGVPVRIGMWRP